MTWANFVAAVLEGLSVDADRRGLELFRTRNIKNAVIDLQRYIPQYQNGHTTTYVEGDMDVQGNAQIGAFPAFVTPTAIYVYSTDTADNPLQRRNRLNFVDWNDRQRLIDGSVPCRAYVYAISPMAKRFMIYPQITVADKTALMLVWRGLKQDFLDGDTVPFPEEACEAVAAYVKWKIILEVDKNPALAASFYGLYAMKRLALHREANEALDAEKRDEENTDEQPSPAALDQFGSQHVPFLRAITALEGAGTNALAAIPTTGFDLPMAVDIQLDDLVQTWVLELGTDASDPANGVLRPNDFDAGTNPRVWYKRT